MPVSGSPRTVSLPPASVARSFMPRKPNCPARPWSLKSFGSISVVAHAQPQFPFVVSDFHFDALRGVAEGVPQCLPGNSVCFVAQNRVQFSCYTRDLYRELHKLRATLWGRQ